MLVSASSRIATRRFAYVSQNLKYSAQVRWESKLVNNNTTSTSSNDGPKKPQSQCSDSDSPDAALLFMNQKNKIQQQVVGQSDRQTVTPPSIPSDAKPISSVRQNNSSSSISSGSTIVGSQKSLNSAATASNINIEGIERFSRLTEEEEVQLSDMREAQGETKQALLEVLKTFDAPIRYAFAYGSGVYKQAGYGGSSKPMIDMVFAVSHPDHWHSINIAQHRNHYSFMGTLGADCVSFVQDKIGAGVYFNPFVEVNGMMIKYGVVSMDTLSSDLLNWNTLYLAGRMHKPTLTLRRDHLMRISKQVNLTHAVRAALLMLPKNFSSTELFQTIAALSFTGDIRMKIGGENPNKIRNIVSAQLPLFKSRYSSIIEGLPNLEYIGQDLLQQDMGPSTRASMVRKMPNNFYLGLVKQGKKAGVSLPPGLGAEIVDTERLVEIENIAGIAKKAVEGIVAGPALTQTLKGVLSAGLFRSISYAREKRNKSKSH